MVLRNLGIIISAITWYEHALSIALADVIAKNFFPAENLIAQYILYLSSMVIGYFGRPFGGFIFGLYADKYNRAKAVQISLSLMFITTIFIVILPNYSKIGLLAPILFILFRFIQGVALAGNYNLWIANLETSKQRYFSSSLLCSGFLTGFLCGGFIISIFRSMFSIEQLQNDVWRVPYLLGFIISMPILISLYKLDKRAFGNNSLKTKEKIKLNYKRIAQIFSVSFFNAVPFYTFFVFLPNYKVIFLQQNGASSWAHYSIGMCTALIATPFCGKLADKYGAIKILKFSSYFNMLSFIVIARFDLWSNISSAIIFGLSLSFVYGSLYGYIPLVFEKPVRARVSNIVVNLAGNLCAGIVPLSATLMAKHNFWYVINAFIGVSVINIVLLHFLKDEWANEN